ncbi:kielin/chordin-like protein isoform X2 [Spodoptera frugiperda]|uniref:Kielin/chordin-like protein isoform X2 n=1 Tax=Spodoptera frugiperda TaxID=7108 RepID=A0A9R0DRS1_SPOFR|nr:kielin/chordin-like protein isoform X2 [Spodoptera frugiperda]
MYRTLWLIILATVCEAFYDEFNMYNWDNERMDDDRRSGLHVHFKNESFKDSLRSFADTYRRRIESEKDIYMRKTFKKVKQRILSLQVFRFLSHSEDFDSARALRLPFPEGSKYCMMGRQTRTTCNYCACVAGQLYMCTGVICASPPKKRDRKVKRAQLRAVSTQSGCVNGTSYMDAEGCNHCYCINNQEYCSLKDCEENENLNRNTNTQCVNGTSYMDDEGCNHCRCIDNIEYCTMRDCSDQTGVCISGTVKEGECGECYCVKETWICSPCEHKKKKYNRLPNKMNKNKLRAKYPECNDRVPGEWFKDADGCNKCVCVHGEMMCTKMKCVKTARYENHRSRQNCKSGTTKEVACGTCFCVSGQWICPICESRDTPLVNRSLTRRSHDRLCIEGERYKTDPCNYCICVDGHDICTNTDCAAIQLDGVVCNPYKDINPKKVDCNVCTCSKATNVLPSRWLWFCTKRDCDSYEKNTKMRKPNIMSTPCKEGNTRQIDNCNHCTCEYGLYVCTNEICETETTTPDFSDYVRRRRRNCEARERKYVKCNRCICMGGQWYCTNYKCAKSPNKLNNDDIDEDFDDSMPLEEITEQDNDSDFVMDDDIFYSDLLSKPTPRPRKRRTTTKRRRPPIHVHRDYTKKRRPTKPRRVKHRYRYSDEYLPQAYAGEALRTDGTYQIIEEEGKKCDVGERFRLGACNYCYCNEHRVRICTKHACTYDSDVDATDYQPKDYVNKRCHIGERFRLDKCNYCYCDAHRKLVCSKHRCSGAGRSRSSLRSPFDENCEAGHVLVDSCIVCTCTANGTYVCAAEDNDECEPPDITQRINVNEHCVDGSKRQIDACNYCTCKDGVEFCSQKPCWNNKPTPYIFPEPECDEDTPIPSPDPCNTCVCIDSDILCTRKPCKHHNITSDYTIIDKQNCVNGEVTSLTGACNVCVCINGNIICTKKQCLEVLESGITKIEMIRTLLRAGDINSQMALPAPGSGCIRGTIYQPEDEDPACGNVCICDGNELFCTRRKCDKEDSLSQLMQRSGCLTGEQIPSSSPCLVCVCMRGTPTCKYVKCVENMDLESEDDDSQDEFNQLIQGYLSPSSKRQKLPPNSTFCEPFTFYSPEGNRFCRNCFCLHDGFSLCLLNLCKYTKDVPPEPVRKFSFS